MASNISGNFIDTKFNAYAYDGDGRRYKNTEVKQENDVLILNSVAPKSGESSSQPIITKYVRSVFTNTLFSYLHAGLASVSYDWTKYHKGCIKAIERDNQNEFPIKTVYAYGTLTSPARKFIFMGIEGEDADALREQLKEDNPSKDELIDLVLYTIKLTEVLPSAAAYNHLHPVVFYYLPVGVKLKVTFGEKQEELYSDSFPLLFVYPSHPDLEQGKVDKVIDQLKEEFTDSLQIVSFYMHPIEIETPFTITSIIRAIVE